MDRRAIDTKRRVNVAYTDVFVGTTKNCRFATGPKCILNFFLVEFWRHNGVIAVFAVLGRFDNCELVSCGIGESSYLRSYKSITLALGIIGSTMIERALVNNKVINFIKPSKGIC